MFVHNIRYQLILIWGAQWWIFICFSLFLKYIIVLNRLTYTKTWSLISMIKCIMMIKYQNNTIYNNWLKKTPHLIVISLKSDYRTLILQKCQECSDIGNEEYFESSGKILWKFKYFSQFWFLDFNEKFENPKSASEFVWRIIFWVISHNTELNFISTLAKNEEKRVLKRLLTFFFSKLRFVLYKNPWSTLIFKIC